MKHAGILTTHACTLMVTIQNTIPKVHGNKETSSNTEIKCEIHYTSNLLTVVSEKNRFINCKPKSQLAHQWPHVCVLFIMSK
jgi:hypothetical protein